MEFIQSQRKMTVVLKNSRQQHATSTRRQRTLQSRWKSLARASRVVLILLLVLALLLSTPAMWMMTYSTMWEWDTFATQTMETRRLPGILPIDLSMNNLQVISKAGGASDVYTEEDFLPITASPPEFRFRLRPTFGASHTAIRDVSAYRIESLEAHGDTTLWDSGKVQVVNGMPQSVEWGGEELSVGSIVKWRVHVWDYSGVGPSTSEWQKFGVGPANNEDWTGQWITHPNDLHSFQNETNLWRHGVNAEQCENWLKRKDLSILRSKFTLKTKMIKSALLVVSGLGSFQTSLNGLPLSSSSILDPPLTDFTARVSYRGYDITSMLKNTTSRTHVVSILLGSAWWDGRPLTCCIVIMNLLPRGPLTCIAQLYIEYSDETRETEIPTSSKGWQVRKGFLLESDLFTGEVVDLGIQHTELKEWNTANGWNRNSRDWIRPEVYKSPITRVQWRQDLGERSHAKQRHEREEDQLYFTVAPIGELVPCEIPPVMPVERIAPESITNLGRGRWLYDFGKGMSGVLRFEHGLPNPIEPPEGYPRGHTVFTRSEKEAFVTVVYGDSLEVETGDVNLNIVAGMGLRKEGRGDVPGIAGPCFPRDHEGNLMQRDVYIAPKEDLELFQMAREPLFTSHGFRFAEVCCTATPPKSVHAVQYRTAFQEWGRFESSNVILNGAYELTRNALNSNMLGTQTDCPHRERLQYGGDLVADSLAAMHFFDLSAFYSKIIHDWIDTQWENGAYTETSIWQELNDYAGIGHGAGETVWASLPPVLTVRHTQHYGDMKLVEETFGYHVKWLEFLKANWEAGMELLFYNRVGKNLENYMGDAGGLGDWLSLLHRDTWLTHQAFFMATARCVAYLAEKLGHNESKQASLSLANKIKDNINSLYMKDGDDAFRMKKTLDLTPGPELALYTRIVPGEKRCAVSKEWFRIASSDTPVYSMPNEEKAFLHKLNKKDLEELEKLRIVEVHGDTIQGLWKRGRNMPEGILAVRYNLRALSDLGFHHVALNKASGIGYPSFEHMMSHNATTLWETWWRSEEVFSRDHPMLGAVAEWLASSVAGVSLDPKTVGGEQVLFWPRIPTSARIIQYASATQGTKKGDASIAWEFSNHRPSNKMYDSDVVMVHIRVLVPPGGTATLKLPSVKGRGTALVKFAEKLPDLESAKSSAKATCDMKRKAGNGFDYNWEFDRNKKEWSKVHRKKAIGTPCKNFLFDPRLNGIHWSSSESVPLETDKGIDLSLHAGFYDVVIDKWPLTAEDLIDVNETEGFCSQPDTFSWEINDATHII